MKLTIILLTAALLNAHAGALSQNVTLNCDHAPLKKVFAEIRKQTGYSFFYNYESLKNARPVSMEVKNIPLQDVLSLCFSDQPLDYYVQSKTVFVMDRPGSPESDTSRHIIQGRIVNEKGLPLDGVSVIPKGTNRGVITSGQGEFIIKEAPGTVLVISRVGYIGQEIKLGNGNTLTISLKARDNSLQDVQVVTYSTGYQQIPKERSTGSFVQISGDELNRQVGSNAYTKLYNITSGLINNSQSTAATEIRGLSTINSVSSPLIVVDNFPYEGAITDINPNDVASVTVLKDAAAASIWGIRAGNGVVVIVTKQGMFNHRPTVGFNTNFTVGGRPDLDYVKTLSGSDEIAFEQMRFARGDYNVFDDLYPSFGLYPTQPQVAELLLAVRKGKITQATADAQIALYEKHNVKDDIRKYILQTTTAQQDLVHFSGGSENYSYYASVGYDQSRGNSKGASNNRITLNFNNVYRPVKNLELTGFINYTQDKTWNNSVPYNQFLPTGNNVAPYTMLADAQGNPLAIPYGYRTAFVDTAKANGVMDWHYRPLAERKFMDNTSMQYNIRLGGIAKYTILPGLSAVVNYQYEKILSNGNNDQSDSLYSVRNTINMYTNPLNPNGGHAVPIGNILAYSNGNQTIWNIRGQLNFNRTFGDHEVDAIAGIERRQNSATSTNGTLYGYDPTIDQAKGVNSGSNVYNYFGQSTSVSSGSGISGNLFRYGSYFTNGAYTYKGRYTLSGSARADQSNFFGVKANQRISPLWSTGAAWNISKESFYKVSWLPYLKLRTTYGYNGNMPSANGYTSTTLSTTAFATASYSTGTIVSPTLPFATVTSPNNPELGWEKVQIVNFAVEAASRNRRLGGSFEYYLKKGTNLIGPIQTDPTTGWLQFNSNNASISGRGFDFVLNTKNIDGVFKWNTDLLLSFNTDKVTAYKIPVTSVSQYFVDYSVVVGKSLYKIYALRSAGLDPTNGDPRFYLAGKPSSYTNMTKATASDLKYFGPSIPHYFGSMMNTFFYKNWSLSANIVYKFDWYFRRTSINYSGLYNGWGGHADYDKRWQKPGDEAFTNVPSLPTGGNSTRDQVYQYSDALVCKGDVIRLQDIRLNYDIPKGQHRWPFQSTQVFVYVNNVGILWRANKYGIDPDAYGFGSIPTPRSISGGINLNF